MDVVAHAAGGRMPGGQLGGGIDFLNRAGTVLYNMHVWDHRLRTENFATVAGQSYVDLPDTFGELVDVAALNVVRLIEVTSMQHILMLRSFSLAQTNYPRYAAVNWQNSSAGEGGEPVPVLELHNTPTAAEDPYGTVLFRRRWPAIDDDDDNVDGVPEFCEELYLQVARELVKGYVGDTINGNSLSVADRITRLKQSSLFVDAAEQDARQQTEYGPITGGHIFSSLVTRGRGSDAVADPT